MGKDAVLTTSKIGERPIQFLMNKNFVGSLQNPAGLCVFFIGRKLNSSISLNK